MKNIKHKQTPDQLMASSRRFLSLANKQRDPNIADQYLRAAKRFMRSAELRGYVSQSHTERTPVSHAERTPVSHTEESADDWGDALLAAGLVGLAGLAIAGEHQKQKREHRRDQGVTWDRDNGMPLSIPPRVIF